MTVVVVLLLALLIGVVAGLRALTPPAVVAWAGLERFARGMTDDLTFAARPRWPLDANAGSLHHGKA
jgi:N6-L-threonylcarbamoyladenine synthase